MKSRYHGDMSLCNQPLCPRKNECWRFQALIRLGEDQEKKEVPLWVSVFAPEPKDCEHFIEDEYDRHNS